MATAIISFINHYLIIQQINATMNSQIINDKIDDELAFKLFAINNNLNIKLGKKKGFIIDYESDDEQPLPIQTKTKTNFYFPDDVWNNIKSYIKYTSKTAQIFNRFFQNIHSRRKLMNNPNSERVVFERYKISTHLFCMRQGLQSSRHCQFEQSKELFKKGILRDFVCRQLKNSKILYDFTIQTNQELSYQKFGTKARFEKSKKDYIKRKKALVRK
jgi:hypothetical protein